MPISTTCPSCRTVYSLADHLRGKKVRCKKCGAAIAVGQAAKALLGEESDDERSSQQQRIQTEARRPSRAPRRDDDEERPRRRKRDDWDEPKPKSNRGLIIGLAAGCGALLLLLLLGGGVLVVIRLRSAALRMRDAADNVPPGTVVVHVTGVTNDFVRDMIQEKLGQLADPGGHRHVRSHTHNGQMTARVSPVQDAHAFAAKIDFGKVQSVEGRTITMVAGKIEGLPGPNADGVDRALFDLKSSNVLKRHGALRKLKAALPDERRAEVCKALEPLIRDPDHFTHEWAIEALGVWGTKETVPVLLRAMNDNETRPAAIKALGRLKDERAIEPIADRLEEFFDRMAATEALKNYGPAAEDAVLKRLNHPDDQVCLAACDILKAIGTQKSLPALQKVTAGGNFLRTIKAKETIKAITARQ